jgi:hypothetical protein
VSGIAAEWPRPLYTSGGGDAFLFYVIYGDVARHLSIPPDRYRVYAVPDRISVMRYGPAEKPEVVGSFRQGYAWEELRRENPDLAKAILAEEHCVIVRGWVSDPPSLDYFRNVIGLLTFLLDQGGAAIYDPQILTWWSPAEWQNRVFAPAAPVPRAHVVTLFSAEADGTRWFHTRGMRKFGRPDLSIHHVAAAQQEGIIDLCNRFIEFQAFGGVIDEGQEIRLHALPSGLRCFHRGHEDDPDFNNVHVAIEPATGGTEAS